MYPMLALIDHPSHFSWCTFQVQSSINFLKSNRDSPLFSQANSSAVDSLPSTRFLAGYRPNRWMMLCWCYT